MSTLMLRKEVFTNALEEIYQKQLKIFLIKLQMQKSLPNSALEQLKAQRINPEVKKNALEAIRKWLSKK